jgi:hypothetical protein
MRALLIAAALAFAQPATAQQGETRPESPAPAATASVEQREAWCQRYAAWFVARSPDAAAPADARATHRLETELNSCMLNPPEYERQTLAELARLTRTG